MTSTDFPPELTCPISRDLMNDPVTVTHQDADYHFDRVCVETWKTTPGGDQNPLSGLPGFRDAPLKANLEIKKNVTEFQTKNGIETEPEQLEPFSDYQQIQDDEVEARRLHMELNVPPLEALPTRLYLSRMYRYAELPDATIVMSPRLIYNSIGIPVALRIGRYIPEDTSNNFGSFSSGFLN